MFTKLSPRTTTGLYNRIQEKFALHEFKYTTYLAATGSGDEVHVLTSTNLTLKFCLKTSANGQYVNWGSVSGAPDQVKEFLQEVGFKAEEEKSKEDFSPFFTPPSNEG